MQIDLIGRAIIAAPIDPLEGRKRFCGRLRVSDLMTAKLAIPQKLRPEAGSDSCPSVRVLAPNDKFRCCCCQASGIKPCLGNSKLSGIGESWSICGGQSVKQRSRFSEAIPLVVVNDELYCSSSRRLLGKRDYLGNNVTMNFPVKPIDSWSRGIRRRLLVEPTFEYLYYLFVTQIDLCSVLPS
ncbi:unnamed protein product [Protopolystoma xenopodis]|uniref:Uncharacterized protein n=1 Tax=Protopolystoma xenopodis TaxID=117903 RepID=A0A3S5BD88_9PLAT|nr:unnamed protein product [Protopolystoma xenopodis]